MKIKKLEEDQKKLKNRKQLKSLNFMTKKSIIEIIFYLINQLFPF